MRLVAIIIVLCIIGAFVSSRIPGFFMIDQRIPLLPLLSSLPFGSQETDQNGRKYLIYGYLPYWTRSNATFHPQLTHVSYFSLTIQPDGSLLDIPSKDQDPGYRAIQKGVLTNLRKEIAPTQQLELSISMMDQDAIKTFIKSPSAQEKFLSDLAIVLGREPIDGINIDIEYNGEVDEALQTQFVNLMKRIRTIAPTTHLSVATYADAASIPRITDPKRLHPIVDHIVVMTYDFHRRSSQKSGPVAPLYGGTGKDQKWDADIAETMKAYTDQVPSTKILLGIPFYGYEWSVTSNDPNAFTLPGSGSTATFKRVSALVASGKATTSWDPVALSPYLQYEDNGQQQVIYYEDERSLGYKLELVKQAQLGGIAIWALGYEGETTAYWESMSTILTN